MNVNHINHSNLQKINFYSVLKNFKWNNLNILFVILLLFVFIFCVFSLFTYRTQYQTVYHHLSDEESTEIISNLWKLKIPYRYVSSSGELFVPKKSINQVRNMLLSEGLPKKKNVGFELLDQEKFGISPFNMQLHYQRALEGELSRFIQTIHAIKTAQVHIAFPKESSFLKDNFLPSASVILSLKDGEYLNFKQCQGITDLISASVPKLLPQNVVILDEQGNYLNKKKYVFHNLHDSQINKIRFLEKDCCQRIIHILKSILQLRHFYVQVKIVKQGYFNTYKNKFNLHYNKNIVLNNMNTLLSSIFIKKTNYVFCGNNFNKNKVSVLILIRNLNSENNPFISVNGIRIDNIVSLIRNEIYFLNMDCANINIIDMGLLNNKKSITTFFIYYLKYIFNALLIIIILICYIIIKISYNYLINNIKYYNNQSHVNSNINLTKIKDKYFNKVQKNVHTDATSIKNIINIIKNKPKLVAMIIQNWIDKK